MLSSGYDTAIAVMISQRLQVYQAGTIPDMLVDTPESSRGL